MRYRGLHLCGLGVLGGLVGVVVYSFVAPLVSGLAVNQYLLAFSAGGATVRGALSFSGR
ncbi:hypothetical protein [Methylobacterium nigriterrae]|uniref:hypothetical protein n=1 Tax=Methylobacterium nigriterrae TaxID=3127512 RepID=UPI0030140EB2